MFDEPESALSPKRPLEFLRILKRMEDLGEAQVIIATHSPLLMAYPSAQLLALSEHGIDPVEIEETEHFRLLSEFHNDSRGFIEVMLERDRPSGDHLLGRETM